MKTAHYKMLPFRQTKNLLPEREHFFIKQGAFSLKQLAFGKKQSG